MIIHTVLLVAVAVVASCEPVCAAVLEVPFSRSEPLTAQLASPGAVAVDAGGGIYVSETGRNQVTVFDPQRAHRTTLSGLARPISLAVDGAGRIYVGNAGRRNVEIYSAELRLLGKLGSGDGEFGRPSGIAIDGEGTVYVADSKENLVKVYRGDGTRQSTIGGGAGAAAVFQFPAALAVNDAEGELIVTDLRDSSLSRGALGGARVQVFTKTGTLLRSFGHFGRGEGLLVKPLGVAVGDEGKVFVSDAYQNVVEVFDRGGSYLGVIHDPEHPLRTPLGVAYDRRGGTLYVSSLTAGWVEIFAVGAHEQTATLTVTPPGEGAGVVSSTPAGLLCPGVCAAAFPAGTTVTLAAEPASGMSFSGWGGACAGSGACVLTMSQDQVVIPHFEVAATPKRPPSDFNGDGISDVLWLHPQSRQVTIWTIDRELRPSAITLGSAQQQRLSGVADADGDGTADVLWYSGEGAVTLWSMNNATIATADTIGARKDPGWEIAGLADFDGDERADVLWRHAGTGEVRLWLMAEHAVGAYKQVGTVRDLQWQIAGIADFDGDRRADILWRNGRTGGLRIWYMSGAKVRRIGQPGQSAARGALIAGSGDFDGDGRADILWRTDADGQLFSWSPAEGPGAAAVLANSPDNQWRLLDVGDYDGDGRSDLLVRERTGSEVAVCISTGERTLRCVALGAAPTPPAGE